MTVNDQTHAFSCVTPRYYQKDFEEAMYSGFRRAYLLYHRRAGKDYACWLFMIKCAANPQNLPGIYYYILPTYKQARKVIWDAVDDTGKRFLDYIPKAWIDGKANNTEMKVRLINGSLIQVIGSDDPDSIRGTNPKGVVFSEYAKMNPRVWDEIVQPILQANKGWAVFNTTPQGRNHAYELWTSIQDSKFWYAQKLTIDDTKLVSIEDIRADKPPKSEELIQQEYYVSFDRGVEGSFYGRLINEARLQNRICNVNYEKRSTVNTAWDLGYGDSTSIVFWQEVGTEIRILDYYEAHGESLAHYIKMLQSKPYIYGSHYFPHDAGSHSLQTGITLQKKAQELGINAKILKRGDLEVGIESVRNLLDICYFDEAKCDFLIKCLENYHKRFNEKMNCYSSTPQHDWSSHGADAIRYMAVAREEYGRNESSLGKEKINEWRQKHLGY